jgi:hypothetical protein
MPDETYSREEEGVEVPHSKMQPAFANPHCWREEEALLFATTSRGADIATTGRSQNN